MKAQTRAYLEKAKDNAVCVLRTSLVLFLTVFASASGWCDTAPFKVEIAIHADSLNADFYKTQGVFFVNTTVRNISGSDQTITVWTQYGWSWLSSSPAIRPGIEASNNVPSQKTLHPGEAYTSMVEMTSDPSGKRPVIFRLGFYPNPTRPVSGMKNVDLSNAVSWSNEVTLDR